MARTKKKTVVKKRKYVRKEDKLIAANRTIEKLETRLLEYDDRLQEVLDASREANQDVVTERDQYKTACDRLQKELDFSNQSLEQATRDLNNVRESLLQHQRNLDLITQSAANNAMQHANFVDGIVNRSILKSVTRPLDNVTRIMNEKQQPEAVVNVDGYGRRVG